MVTVRVEFAELFAGGVTEIGFTVHVVFAGQPETVNETELLNPNLEVTVIVEFPEPPCVSVNDVGLADSEKSGGGGFIVSETVVEWPLPLPLIVRVEVPVGVLAFVVTVNTEPAEPFAGGVKEAGLRAQVALAGQPDTVSATELLNPAMEVTVIVEFPELPCVSVNDVGFADIEKSGGAA